LRSLSSDEDRGVTFNVASEERRAERDDGYGDEVAVNKKGKLKQ
jgi:hypothetical protein